MSGQQPLRPPPPARATAPARRSHSTSSHSRSLSLREESSPLTSSQPPNDNTAEFPSAQPSATPQTPFTPNALLQSPVAAQGQPYFRVPASPRSSISAMSTGEPSSKAAKVAIPRLKRPLDVQDGSSKPGGRHRVTHACEPCRHRKTKCSGDRPLCRHCLDFKIQCYYADGKRDRVKKQFGSMAEKVADYEKLLKDLASRATDEDAALIKGTLDRAAQLDADELMQDNMTAQSVEADHESGGSGAESEASGHAGSTGALDRTEEDFTREAAKTTGYMGMNSDVTWMQRLRKENKYGDMPEVDPDDPKHQRPKAMSGPSMGTQGVDGIEPSLAETDTGLTIHDSSYHLNDLAITTPETVDAYEMPTQETAQTLFFTYFHRVHPNFPIVNRLNLQNQFAKFLARPMNRPPPKWLAIINLIFAISAKYSHLIQAEWQADERDHLIYFTRARILSIDDETLFTHPDLQSIQVFGLMAFYLLAIDQINRSWQVAGFAVRSANSLGLNMYNESSELSDDLKEIRYRVWWALYVLEHRLCCVTGRVNCITDSHCTTPLPVPLPEDDFDSDLGKKLLSHEHQRNLRAPASNPHTPSLPESTSASTPRSGSKHEPSRSPSMTQPAPTELDWAKEASPNSALCFLHLVQLCRLTQLVFYRLYNPTALDGSWSDTQSTIKHLSQQLENWYRKLPPAFDFRRKQRDRDYYEARLALGFYYYGTKQMLHRPCLCRLDRKIPNQSSKSTNFNHSAAIACVTAAQEQLHLIPDEPNAVGLLRVGPWTSILHMIVQSAIVLMLEISFRAHHMPEQAEDVLEASKKAVRWLHALGEDNLAAARAWRMCNTLLHDAAKKIGRTVQGMPNKLPRAAESTSDTGMSSSAATPHQTYDHGLGHGQGSTPNIPPPTSIPTSAFGISAGMSGDYGFGGLDPLMHYDQYFPSGSGIDPANMHYTQNPGQSGLQYDGVPGDVEMNFMNRFTAQNHDSTSSRRGGGNRSGRSGFG